MKQEEKYLLIKDLSCRLPYGVKVHAKYTDLGETIEVDGILKMIDADGFVGIKIMYDTSSAWTCVDIDYVKPYLFPLSSMTEEQKEEYCSLQQKVIYNSKGLINSDVMEYVNWCYKNHIDINDLIPKKLANNAAGLNIYQLCDLMKVKCKLRTPPLNNPQITIGTKIRSKANPDVILSIISNDCHEDEFECSNGSVLSLKQIEKYYDII